MANYQTNTSCSFPVGAGNVAAALDLYEQMEAELDAAGEEIGFKAESDDPGDDQLWLWDGDGQANVENIIAYVLKCAAAFNLTGLWGFHWSLSCDRAVVDAFGGGAQLLDLGRRESVGWIDTGHWLAMRLATGAPRPCWRRRSCTRWPPRRAGPRQPRSVCCWASSTA